MPIALHLDPRGTKMTKEVGQPVRPLRQGQANGIPRVLDVAWVKRFGVSKEDLLSAAQKVDDRARQAQSRLLRRAE